MAVMIWQCTMARKMFTRRSGCLALLVLVVILRRPSIATIDLIRIQHQRKATTATASSQYAPTRNTTGDTTTPNMTPVESGNLDPECEHIPSNASSHLCLNQDFVPCHRTSAWTMLTDELAGALVLGHSIRTHTTANPIDMVILELSHKPLHPNVWKRLQAVGWKRCQVDAIDPVHVPSTDGDVDQYAKLRLWGMTMYERVIYMDSDALVVGSINELVQFNLPTNKVIGANHDFVKRRFTAFFNVGVFVIHPSLTEYNRLVELQTSGSVEYTHSQSLQGWLNSVYKNQWQEIGFEHNANLLAYSRKREHWNKFSDKLAVVHYTIEKPWACPDEYREPCMWWQQVYTEVAGANPCQNLDFEATHHSAVVTLNTGPTKHMNAYVDGTILLGLSVRRHTTVPVDLVLMEIISKPLPDEVWAKLESVGWKKCVVSRIEPPQTPIPQFLDQFTKLHIWGLSSYDSLVYMDSDAFVVSDMDGLLSMELGVGSMIGAARDFRGDQFVSTFNLGVCKIHPNIDEYNRLLTLSHDASGVEYETAMCEQGWLNVVYKNRWQDIGFRYNANTAAISQLGQSVEDVSVVHFTIPKPWECSRSPVPYCRAWYEALREYQSKTDYKVERTA